MFKAPINWLSAIIIMMVCSTGWAAQTIIEEPTEKFVGRWDRNAGIISVFIKEINGIKQARLLIAEEHVESAASKLSIAMMPSDLDELEDLIEDTLKELVKSENLPVPSIRAKEVWTPAGQLAYPNGTIKVFIVIPPGTRRYVTMIAQPLNPKIQFLFWMDKEDLVSLKKLFDRALNELGES